MLLQAIALPDTAARIPESRFQQFAREGSTSFAHRIDRYAPHRRRAILVALLIDQQSRLADAALDMADRLIGNAFTRDKHAKEKTVVASTKDVSRLMRLFQGTIEALRSCL